MSSRPERVAMVTLLAVPLLGGCSYMPRCGPAGTERINQLERDNRALRGQLDDAQAKIKALTAIEPTLGGPAPRNQGR